ncbi:hypothetical protein B2G71_18285 [Novosphingobium sp. PC22D]|uniref:DUF805 domain-containing protein n=1 Tax=Novosphingobium sp. PC22D TaxID=1962403 RepID=UPI000BF015CF|nr:DUF805 domain-containing protein [Novosphingobium sp. PC22D]PEQ11236.1 hypothetical protein B2G71_18285 [Novosphingobium sp. PC22D]
MLAAVKYNLAHLVNFEGRDARQTFWYYVLFLFIMQYILGFVVAIPVFGSMFGEIINAATRGASEVETEAMLMGRMASSLRMTMNVQLALGFVFWLLLVAAFARRLQDSGKPGWIAFATFALAIAGQLYGLWYAGRLIDRMAVPPGGGNPVMAMNGMRGQVLGMSLFGWLPTILVVGFGILRSDEGPNRYGDEPVRF